METLKIWGNRFQESLVDLTGGIATLLPQLIAALFLLALGWVLARIARRGSISLVRIANNAIDRLVNEDLEKNVRRSDQAAKVIGNIVFWIVILIFGTAAIRKLGFNTISGWLESVVNYLPTGLAGFAIIGLGYLVSTLVRDLTSSVASSAGIEQNRLAGLTAQAMTFLVGLVIGLDQIGIDVAFLVTILAILLGSLSAGIALAFGLGARTFADNLINLRHVQRLYQCGQTVKIADVEGEILEFTPTSVVVAGKQGRVAIPARLFGDQTSVLLTPEQADA